MRTARLGLTGGIGSGKSTVARMLAELGAAVIDLDLIARQLTQPGGAAIEPIARELGRNFVDANGALDRELMRRWVFGNPQARKKLEDVLHPLIRQTALQEASQASSPCVVLDIPLLVESNHWRQQLDRILVVDCLVASQISRVVTRTGWTPEAARKVIAAQASRTQRLAASDLCIYNEGISLEQLHSAVVKIAANFGLSSAHPLSTKTLP